MPFVYLEGTVCATCNGTDRVLVDLQRVGLSPVGTGFLAIGCPPKYDSAGNYRGNEMVCLVCDGKGQQRKWED